MNDSYTTTAWDTNSQFMTISASNYSRGLGAKINNNQNNNMKETSRDLYKLTFLKTTVTEHVYEVLAESLEEAEKVVADGVVNGDSKTISIDIELYSAEDSDGDEVEE